MKTSYQSAMFGAAFALVVCMTATALAGPPYDAGFKAQHSRMSLCWLSNQIAVLTKVSRLKHLGPRRGRAGSATSQYLRRFIAAGTIVPDAVTLAMAATIQARRR